jgi:transposase
MVTSVKATKSTSKTSVVTAETPLAKLPSDVTVLKQMVQQLLEQMNDKTRENFDLRSQVDWLKRQMFGRKSETLDPNQRLLFEDAFTALAQELDQQQVPSIEEPSDKKRKTRNTSDSKRNGRAPLPADLPRVKEYIDPVTLPANTRCIGEDITEILEYIPASFYVRQIIRRKYVQNDGFGSVFMGALPPLPIEKGRPGVGLIAYIIISKYCDHLPLYRQEQIFKRYGLSIARSTLCDWVGAGSELLVPIVQEMKRQILTSAKIHTDDTYIPVQDKTKTQVRKGYLWPYIDMANNVYFDYTRARNRAGPEGILSGYTGHIQADAFNGYDNLYGDEKATESGCWAHARRKFDESLETDPIRANQMLALIAELYMIERKARDDGLDADQIKALRQQFSQPILHKKIKPLLDEWQGSVLPKSPMGKAVTYAQNQWDALLNYLEDGILSIDNNLAERVIKMVALGRKNWLFAGSDVGAKRAAVLYSLVASCKLCEIDPFSYLRDVLDRINTHPASRIEELVPHRWKELYSPKVTVPNLKTKPTH